MGESEHEVEHGDGPRCMRELSSCLLELSRLVRGIAFYPTSDPHRNELLNRTTTAWRNELERGGELQLCVDGVRIAIADLDEPLEGAHIEHLARAIRQQEIAGISLAPGVERDAIEGLALLLASDPGELDSAAAFESWCGQGIAIIATNGVDHDSKTVPAPPSVELPAPPSVEEKTEATSSAAHLEQDGDEPSGVSSVESLERALGRLDAIAGGDEYIDACAELLEVTSALVEDCMHDEAYRAVLAFTSHASGTTGLDDESRAHAQASLRELCDGELLQFTISRACDSPDPRSEVRAAQVLLELGELAVPLVLQRLRAASEPERLAQLSAVVLALGERAVGPLLEELSTSKALPSRVVIQLAGELQSPRLVPSLVDVLRIGDPVLRQDAARALVTIGPAAARAFFDALNSPDDDLVRIATHCLGKLGHRRAVGPLVSALDRALREGRDGLARDTIRALAEIGDPHAVEPLVEIAGRRDWLRRSRQQDIKLAAVGAIDRIPGDIADRALRQLREVADPRVAARAAEALARRSPVDSAKRA